MWRKKKQIKNVKVKTKRTTYKYNLLYLAEEILQKLQQLIALNIIKNSILRNTLVN